MNKNWKFLIAGVILFALSLIFCQRAEEGLSLTHILLSHPLNAAEISQITRQEAQEAAPLRFCFQGQGEDIAVSSPLTGVSRTVTPTYLAGNPELMNAAPLLWQEGCLIDEGTAQALFGTPHCGFQLLKVGNRTLPVLGTVPGSLPRILLLAQPQDGPVLNRLVLSLPQSQGAGQGEAFLLRHDLTGTLLAYDLPQSLMKNLLLLFPALLSAAFWRPLRKGYRTLTLSGVLHGQQRTLLLRTALSFLLTLGTLWYFGRRLTIPAHMLPTRWSDFSFWGRWWKVQKENCLTIASTAPTAEQLQMTENMVKSIGTALAADLLALRAVRRNPHANPAD